MKKYYVWLDCLTESRIPRPLYRRPSSRDVLHFQHPERCHSRYIDFRQNQNHSLHQSIIAKGDSDKLSLSPSLLVSKLRSSHVMESPSGMILLAAPVAGTRLIWKSNTKNTQVKKRCLAFKIHLLFNQGQKHKFRSTSSSLYCSFHCLQKLCKIKN